jgi:hypothetical protein
MIHTKALWVAVMILSFSLGQTVLAANKQTVRVRFVLQQYTAQYRDIPTVQTRAEELLTKYLNERLPFLRFSKNDGVYTLLCVLAVRDATASPAGQEVGLHVSLSGPGLSATRTYWLTFRSASAAAASVPTEEELLALLNAIWASADYNKLVARLLSRVPISSSGVFVRTDLLLGWVLPFTKMDLCMDDQSRLQVENELAIPPVRLHNPYRAVVVGSFEPPTPDVHPELRDNVFGQLQPTGSPSEAPQLQQLRNVPTENVTVTSVTVNDYKPLGKACVPVPPDVLAGGSGK